MAKRSKFAERLDTLGAVIRREVAKDMYAAGSLVATEAQISISTGAVSGKNHAPSAPHTAPNNDTATLANGIQVLQVAPLHVLIVSTAPYSADLEYGTSKMADRPFMRPAADKSRAEVTRRLTSSAARAVHRHFRGQ
jgi:HK97 gp10 family phage protein